MDNRSTYLTYKLARLSGWGPDRNNHSYIIFRDKCGIQYIWHGLCSDHSYSPNDSLIEQGFNVNDIYLLTLITNPNKVSQVIDIIPVELLQKNIKKFKKYVKDMFIE